jgi:hypothetical protein
MSESLVGEQSWERMTESEKAEAVRQGHATLKQMMQGLLDGPERLRQACRDFLAHTGASFDDIPLPGTAHTQPLNQADNHKEPPIPKHSSNHRSRKRLPKQRFGLPDGFVPRMQRYGRSILLEENIYRLPNGLEFVPCFPTSILGRLHHLYALLTEKQYQRNERGSVYVRTDGRIFDYSVDLLHSEREMFDTGYTIHDLERTGRYAARRRSQRRTLDSATQKRAAKAS